MSAYGNQKAAFAAQRRSVHRKDDLWCRVRLAPHLSRMSLQPTVFERNPCSIRGRGGLQCRDSANPQLPNRGDVKGSD